MAYSFSTEGLRAYPQKESYLSGENISLVVEGDIVFRGFSKTDVRWAGRVTVYDENNRQIAPPYEDSFTNTPVELLGGVSKRPIDCLFSNIAKQSSTGRRFLVQVAGKTE